MGSKAMGGIGIMLRKFVRIQNVGKFRNCCASGDVEFRKLTLIFGENGRGKTTIGAILRSAMTGDANPILERHTIDATAEPIVELLLEGETLRFKSANWSNSCPNLAIFDSSYVTQNVYTGDHVSHNHKKSIARIVLGAQGVSLANQVDALDAAIRDATSNLKILRSACEKHIPKGNCFEEFCSSPEDLNIDSKISAKKDEVAALASADAIRAKPPLSLVQLPTLPSNLEACLMKGLDEVSRDAESKVLQHIQKHRMGEAGQEWITQGLPHITNDDCPFCGANVVENQLILAYRTFFGAGYVCLKQEVSAIEAIVEEALGQESAYALQRTLLANDDIAEFWSGFLTVDLPSISYEADVVPTKDMLRNALSPYLKRKVSSPLEPITVGPEVDEAWQHWNTLIEKVKAYSNAVSSINLLIEEKKKKCAAGDITRAKSELLRLEAQKIRQEPMVAKAFEDYIGSLKAKDVLVHQKDAAKAALTAYTENVLSDYETRLNNVLKRFNTGFRITGSRVQYLGGSTSSSFQLSINGKPIELGDESTTGKPCFRSAMSAGDRSTLGLAFFLVELQDRANLEEFTVVFDDPFTSLDNFRQNATKAQVVNLLGKAKQVVVMSHYAQFLALVAEGGNPSETRLLQLSGLGKGRGDSEIRSWDMAETLENGYDRDIAFLSAFEHGDTKDKRAVMRCIRPTLESHIRRLHPTLFPRGLHEWLGQMLDKIRSADDGHPLTDLKQFYEVLLYLNDYTKQYHHDDNSDLANHGPIQELELGGAVRQTLEFVGRL